jgi:hypothetical protein
MTAAERHGRLDMKIFLDTVVAEVVTVPRQRAYCVLLVP